ncbi:MAG: hypothetical protein GXP31_09825, partial [Kiritimatiellaeota bacterium]|nr:hypothetical protein [Kiritimatiellota bacterium]
VELAVEVRGGAGRPVAGGVLLDIDVRGPDGGRVTRFSRHCAPLDGRQKVVLNIPLNVARGRYDATVRVPHAGLEKSVAFTVR